MYKWNSASTINNPQKCMIDIDFVALKQKTAFIYTWGECWLAGCLSWMVGCSAYRLAGWLTDGAVKLSQGLADCQAAWQCADCPSSSLLNNEWLLLLHSWDRPVLEWPDTWVRQPKPGRGHWAPTGKWMMKFFGFSFPSKQLYFRHWIIEFHKTSNWQVRILFYLHSLIAGV